MSWASLLEYPQHGYLLSATDYFWLWWLPSFYQDGSLLTTTHLTMETKWRSSWCCSLSWSFLIPVGRSLRRQQLWDPFLRQIVYEQWELVIELTPARPMTSHVPIPLLLTVTLLSQIRPSNRLLHAFTLFSFSQSHSVSRHHTLKGPPQDRPRGLITANVAYACICHWSQSVTICQDQPRFGRFCRDLSRSAETCRDLRNVSRTADVRMSILGFRWLRFPCQSSRLTSIRWWNRGCSWSWRLRYVRKKKVRMRVRRS